MVQKLMESTPSVTWTSVLLGHKSAMVIIGIAWPYEDDGGHPPESLWETSQVIATDMAPEAPPQIVHRYRAETVCLIGVAWP